MSRVVGPGWLLAGDASGFIDPVLSTGVFLAMHAGRQAAHGCLQPGHIVWTLVGSGGLIDGTLSDIHLRRRRSAFRW